MPPHTWRWRIAYAAILLAGLLIFLSWLAPWARADGPDTYNATGYGDGYSCCWGSVSRDGREWYQFRWQDEVTVAHISIPRGTPIALWIPPQADAYQTATRSSGFGLSAYPDGAQLTVADSCWIGPGVPCPRNQVDLSYGLLTVAGFCAPTETAYRCLTRWGRRAVYLWIVDVVSYPELPSFDRLPALG